mmetsp:Transcript_58137/g.136329  ORF Transcript_58137/g.136329 Transcript_58137/m.136329 type:complete len:413 (-) Transcript_58137:65-1303(-)
MIRLYPHADKLQRDIQELREQLAQRQQENEEEMCRLQEAASQIGELYDQVHVAEKEQEELSAERIKAQDETEKFQMGEVEAGEARKEAHRKLSLRREEHEQQLEALAHGETESYVCWMRMQRTKMKSMNLTMQLADLSTSLEDLWQESEAAVEVRDRLRGEWADVVALATVERGQVSEVHAQMMQLRGHAAVAEAKAAELCDEAVDSEVASSELWQSLARVEGQDHRRDGLTADLQSALGEQEELRAHIWYQEQYDCELLAALAESEAQRSSVTESLKVDAVRWEEIRANINETRHVAAELYSELALHADGARAVSTRHAEAEEAGISRLQLLQSEFREHAGEGQNLDSKAAELEKESQHLQSKLHQAQQQKEGFVADLARKEEDHEELLVKKAELNAELEELKKKFRCIIS